MKRDFVSVHMKFEAEYETRRDIINVILKNAGWDPKDLSKVVQEADTKQSDFKLQNSF